MKMCALGPLDRSALVGDELAGIGSIPATFLFPRAATDTSPRIRALVTLPDWRVRARATMRRR